MDGAPRVLPHFPEDLANKAARTLAKPGVQVKTGLMVKDLDRGGRIKVGPQLTVGGYPDIYVVGDLALSIDSNGKPLPGVAQVAMQQGTYAAQ
jgi:NADH dehydrogenase FAD-containing subunit